MILLRSWNNSNVYNFKRIPLSAPPAAPIASDEPSESRSRNPSQPHLRARGLRWFNDSISQPRGATTLRGWITWGSAWRSRGLLISVDRFLKGQQGTGNEGELSDPGGGVGPVSPSSSHPYLDNGEGDPKLSISNYTFQSHPRSSSPMRLPVTTWFLIFPSPKAASGEPANNRVHTRRFIKEESPVILSSQRREKA